MKADDPRAALALPQLMRLHLATEASLRAGRAIEAAEQPIDTTRFELGAAFMASRHEFNVAARECAERILAIEGGALPANA